VTTTAEDPKAVLYARLTENNEWEGEAWHFYIPVDGNEEALAKLKAMIDADNKVDDQDNDDREYEMDDSRLTEQEVDTLVASPSATDYMAEHNKLSGRLDMNGVEDLGALYKGQIAGLMRG
jgi:hypothetical protein